LANGLGWGPKGGSEFLRCGFVGFFFASFDFFRVCGVLFFSDSRHLAIPEPFLATRVIYMGGVKPRETKELPSETKRRSLPVWKEDPYHGKNKQEFENTPSNVPKISTDTSLSNGGDAELWPTIGTRGHL